MKNSKKTETKELREMIDIKNSERFFERTGEELRECYEYYCEEKIGQVDIISGTQEIFLYIPDAENDIYTLYLN